MPPSDFAESSPSISDEIPAIIASLERIELRQQKMLVEIMIRLNAIEAKVAPQADGDEPNDERPSNGPREMDWEAQKRKIFAAHGMPVEDDEAEPNANDSSTHAISQIETRVEPSESIDAEDEHLNDSSTDDASAESSGAQPAISAEDQEEIAQLKKELREKLRQAEMELSISRAKISRENAMLEERKAELEQLAHRLKTQSGAAGQESPKLSMLDRLNRHMKTLKRTPDADSE